MLKGWTPNMVCMMSGSSGGADSTPPEDVPVIKQEEDRYCTLPDHCRDLPSLGALHGSNTNGTKHHLTNCGSPSTTVLYSHSPSTTAPKSETFFNTIAGERMKREYEEDDDTLILTEDILHCDDHLSLVTSSQSLFDYNDCTDELGSSPRQVKRYREPTSSSSSPESQFCSSTTSTEPPLTSPECLKEEDGRKRTCLVCGDTASGYHYGVASCEACKAFFKRTIQGNIEYNCPATNDCEINKRRRKACQACRFHKCLNVGMLKEGVRLDRVRGGRQKYRRTTDTPFSMNSPPVKKTSLEEIKLLTDLQACEPEGLLTYPIQAVCDPEYVTVATLADIYDRELVTTIGWARQIPGFTNLCLSDQMDLLKSTWGEILTLSLAYRSRPSHARVLKYTPDFPFEELQARDCNAEEVFTKILGVIERLEQCNITHEEYLLLKALVLTNSDSRLENSQALFKLRQSILQAIHDAASSLRSTDATAHMQSLLLCLPSLRAADTCLRKYWLEIRQEGNVSLNKLFLEMLESGAR